MSAALLLVVASGVFSQQALSEVPRGGSAPPAEEEFSTLLGQLADGLASGDLTLVDDALCLDWMVPDWLERAARLAAVAGPGMTLDEALPEYREAATRRLRARLEGDAAPTALDVSRVRLLDAGEDTASLGGMPITGSGVLGVHWSSGGASDLPVLRVGEHWCLNPGAPVAVD